MKQWLDELAQTPAVTDTSLTNISYEKGVQTFWKTVGDARALLSDCKRFENSTNTGNNAGFALPVSRSEDLRRAANALEHQLLDRVFEVEELAKWTSKLEMLLATVEGAEGREISKDRSRTGKDEGHREEGQTTLPKRIFGSEENEREDVRLDRQSRMRT